jgi:GTP-binding protein Era
VGKSTLLNRILGDKLAIVSPRPQTTRNRILGIRTYDGRDQLMLLDTPGIHRRRGQLNRFMVKEALDSLEQVDCILLLTEVSGRPAGSAGEDPGARLHPGDSFVLDQVRRREAGAPLVVVINKIDRLRDRGTLLPLMAAWGQRGFPHVVPISALRGDGTGRLVELVRGLLPAGPLLFPEEMLTDRAERFLVAEMIREQVFLRCRQELPYATAVEIERFDERPGRGDVMIEAAVIAERESQKPMLIGKGGAMIRDIGSAARAQIARLLGCEVHLRLRVRVEPGWTRSPASRRRLGYE